MKKNICLFEDSKYEGLLPLVYTRPVFDLRCGILTLREKVNLYFLSYKLCLSTRRVLHNLVQERYPKLNVNYFENDDILFINGRLLLDKQISKEIKKLERNSAITSNGVVVAAFVTSENIEQLFMGNSEFPLFENISLNLKEVSTRLLSYPWEFVNENGNQIKNDFTLIAKEVNTIKKYNSVEFNNRKNIYVSKDAKIGPFVYLDASSGPIYISKGTHIMSHALIQGPVYIGEGSVIKANSSIYHNTSIGDICKVGGEVESSIILSYTNKQHDGFLGHAYLGSWINLGASTNNSDLKNNYSNVTVLIKGNNYDTKSQFVGLIMGDHSKTAINTIFNTGSIVGVSCNIFGSGFPARYVPSFSWGGTDFIRNYEIEKCIEVAKIVLERRKLKLSIAEEELLRYVYEITKHEKIKKS